jgi:hypothetical protein
MCVTLSVSHSHSHCAVLCCVVYLSMVWDLLLLLFIAVPSTDRLAIPTGIEGEGNRKGEGKRKGWIGREGENEKKRQRKKEGAVG